MNIELKDGRLHFSLIDAIGQLTGEQKRDAITILACDDEVITMVGQQLVDGMTEDGSCGGILCTASATPWRGLDKARRDVAKASGDIARQEIERLEQALAACDKQRLQALNELHERTRVYG
ncbi:hypothetical protein [Achromobacter sp. NFACC18-2]|uniref:hypothetical protein n=1 Tax=Achromobacter sp. NFACC18-2 TaxID=1564112 RepID=UPI0008C800B4|nr:hypothetical protein [Achromobacter sp. NFACC18-2]SEI77964.1 hypothetical protein SAMN03159494_00977 [Achromobacter sp. NFACC18-2]